MAPAEPPAEPPASSHEPDPDEAIVLPAATSLTETQRALQMAERAVEHDGAGGTFSMELPPTRWP